MEAAKLWTYCSAVAVCETGIVQPLKLTELLARNKCLQLNREQNNAARRVSIYIRPMLAQKLAF